MIKVDLSHVSNTSNVRTLARAGGSGVYYEVDADVVMLFGGTEIEAQLCWNENVRFQNCLYDRSNLLPSSLTYFQGVEKR